VTYVRRSVSAPIVDVLLDQDLDSQGPFELVIQKLTDELVASQRGDAAAKKRIESFVVLSFLSTTC